MISRGEDASPDLPFVISKVIGDIAKEYNLDKDEVYRFANKRFLERWGVDKDIIESLSR